MTLNKTQKTIILIAILCIVAMALYPPWVLRERMHENITRPGPYALLWLPPYRARFVDLYRFSIQFVAVLVIAIGLCLVCHTKKH